MPVCPVDLTADLIRCSSVTPEDGGALVLLEQLLSRAGFTCTRADRAGTPNLLAYWGARDAPRVFGFNGHTDVVPVGNQAAWSVDPFGAEIRDGRIWGRGACDMKSGVAAFAAAAMDFVSAFPPDGAICIAITGDEEGPATDGTLALLDRMREDGIAMSVCLVGEPTSAQQIGDMLKIGRRGSINAVIEMIGVQGHVAYPDLARNPVAAMAELAHKLASHELDQGSAHFDASSLQLTSIDVGNAASNVVPERARMALNIRFNELHSGADLAAWLEAEAADVAGRHGIRHEIEHRISGESFVTPPGALSDLVSRAVLAETGRMPALSTTGGTSDARFVRAHCPVVEFGLTGTTLHQVDENVLIEEIHQLKAIYARILKGYFDGA